ncbi:MAG: cyclic nucleotide-binding domain-containing protein [Gammaproteobacteria bacterium]
MMTANDIINILKKNLIFQGFTDEQYTEILPFFEQIELGKEVVFMKQNTEATDMFIIVSGSVVVLKTDSDNHQHCISTLHKNNTIGELAFLQKTLRSASVKTLEETTLLKLNVTKFGSVFKKKFLYKKLYRNLAKHFSSRLRDTNDIVVTSLQKNLRRARDQVNMGNLTVTTIIILTLFIFSLNILNVLAKNTAYTTTITLPLLMLVCIAAWLNIKRSGYPLSFYGITFANSKTAILESVLYTLPVIIMITFIKWASIQLIPSLHNEALFHFTADFGEQANTHFLTFMTAAYILLSAPIQEFIFRGTLQASLSEFLISKYNIFLSILVTNLIFALIHLTVSIVLAGFAFLVGIFWGWLYHRHKTLTGVTLSHMIIGAWVFFVLGLQNIISQLI